jgi:hypothetical protein
VAHCLLSCFQLHNETVNVWSHLLGFLFFAYMSFQTLYTYWDMPAAAVMVRSAPPHRLSFVSSRRWTERLTADAGARAFERR